MAKKKAVPDTSFNFGANVRPKARRPARPHAAKGRRGGRAPYGGS